MDSGSGGFGFGKVDSAKAKWIRVRQVDSRIRLVLKVPKWIRIRVRERF